MADSDKERNRQKTTRKYLTRLLIAVLSLVVLIVLALSIYLATPLPARQVSNLLSNYLHQNFTIDSLKVTGGALRLQGVRLENPAGFPEGSLAAADSVVIAPLWGDLLHGRQRFRLVALDGIRVDLAKDSKGTWNFAQLQQLFASQKAAPTETRIGQLSIKNGSLMVNGQGVQRVALQVFDLATKGSSDSSLDLSFEDAAHNRFTLKGDARAGADPSVNLVLSAPALSLKGVAAELKLKKPELFEGGTGALQIHANLQKGELNASGNLSFDHLRYAAAKKSYPLAGNFDFAADYSLSRDTVQLKKCLVTLNDRVWAQATGSAQDLKKGRHFVLDVSFNEIDLGLLNSLLPEASLKNLEFGGKLVGQSLHLAGSGSTLSGVSGTLQLREGALARAGRLYLDGLDGTVGFTRSAEGVHAKGRLSLAGTHAKKAKALLEALDMPFDLTLSHNLKPLKAEIPALSAQVMGVPFSGRLAFDASRENPVAASLKVPATAVSRLQPLWERYGVTAGAGTAAVTLDLAGKSLQQLAGTAEVQLADLKGARGKSAIGLKKGSVGAKFRRGGGHLLVQGEARLKGIVFDGQGGDASFTYRVADRMAYLDGVEVSAAGARLAIAHLSGAIPANRAGARTSRIPISVDFDGCSVQRRELEVSSLSGRIRGNLLADSSGRWLEGTAALASDRVVWQGRPVAAPAVQAVFSRTGAQGELRGKLLGGALAGSLAYNPFAPEAGAKFDVGLKDAELAAVAPFLPKGAGASPTGGLVELHLAGAYSRAAGLSCRFQSQASRVALAKPGGKALVSGAAFSLGGELAGDQLKIDDAVLSPGPGVAAKVKGTLTHPFSAQRAGSLTFSLPETAANSIIDSLINLVPRAVQEATIEGTLAADGKLQLAEGKRVLEGGLVLTGARYEVPAQKLVVAGISGRIPFSLDLSGKTGNKPPGAMNFSRENYPRLLEQLRKPDRRGEQVTVGKIAFGPVELGTLTMHLNAGYGLTEITSLHSSLYEGMLLGKGYLSMQDGVAYRGDLLVNDVSLKKLCSIFPGIQGYISGRVDGVISVSGGAKGLVGLSGFTELWARGGSGEKMLVSKEFLQRLAKQKLSGFFFRSDRSYDQAEIKALMEQGNLTFEKLSILHTNLLGVRDLNVSIAPTQNRIALDHLFDSIKQAATRGKAASGEPATGEAAPAAAPATQEFKWGE